MKIVKYCSILFALLLMVGLLSVGQTVMAATNITSASFSFTGAKIGKNVSDISVSTNTTGLTIVDTRVNRATNIGSELATGTFTPGSYSLQIFANAKSGYSVSGLTNNNITINGQTAYSLSNPWNYQPKSQIMIVYWFDLGDGSPVFLDGSFEEGNVGIPYEYHIRFSGDDPIDLTYEGTLPPGLSIVGHCIEGKPTKAGTYTFTLKARNSKGSATKNCSIEISPYTGGTLINKIDISVSGINVGDKVTNAKVTTTTSGVHIIDYYWDTTDVYFRNGEYPLIIRLEPLSGYSFAALVEDDIIVNGKDSVYQFEEFHYDSNSDSWSSRIVDYISVGSTLSTSISVSAFSGNPEQGTVTGFGHYSIGDSVTLTAIPKSGYEFYYWFDHNTGTVVTGAGASFTFTASDDVMYSAYFRSIPQINVISVSSEDAAKGTVSGGGKYYTGTLATITATPKDGYTFDCWTDDRDGTVVVGAGASYTFTVTEHKTYVAHFKGSSPISSVSVTLDAPAVGTKPDYTATLPSGAPYFSDAYNEGNYRNDIGWWNENTHNHVNPDTAVFQAGSQYKVYVYLTAQDGYAFTNSTTATLNGQPAEASVENGQLLVQYTFPKLTAITRGDLNGDGSVNQKDLAMLSKYMRNSTLYPLNETAMAAADINGDGNVNQKDLAKLSKYMRNPTAYPLP